jgi:predicted nucleic acid-binding protein
MNIPLIIPDASIIIGFVLQEPEHIKVIETVFRLGATKKITFRVPSICQYEVANTLAGKKEYSTRELNSVFRSIPVVDLQLSVMHTALELMNKQKKISFYDASYHALAIESDGLFLTADKQYVNLMKDAGSIQFIGDYA